MQLSRLTFSLASLIVLLTFFALPVMAHDDGATQTTTSHNPSNGPGTDHILLESFEVSGNYLNSAESLITATVTFAAHVAAVDEAGDNATDLHATSLVVSLTAATDFTIEKWNPTTKTYGSSGELELVLLTAGGVYDENTTTATTFTFRIRVNPNASPAATDGHFRISVGNANDQIGSTPVYPAGNGTTDNPFDPGAEALQPVIYYDKTPPTITVQDTGSRSQADLTANQWRGPFSLQISVTDEAYDFTTGASTVKVVETDESGTALETTAQNVSIGSLQQSGDKYTVRIVPTLATTAKTPIHFKVTAMDKAGNSGTGMLTTNLASGLSPISIQPTFKTPAKKPLIGICFGEALPETVATGAAALPLADHDESISVSYSFDEDLPAGLSLSTIDRETRFIVGTPTEATLDAGTTLTWRATDDGDSANSATTKVTIIVKALQLPKKPTGLTATKLDSADLSANTKNRVRLTWMQPEDKSDYPDCIPLPKEYMVYVTKRSELTGQFPENPTETYDSSTTADRGHFTRDTNGVATHFTKQFGHGTYKFQIAAHNTSELNTNKTGMGNSPKSDDATWTVKDSTATDVTLDYVVVAAPPGTPTDLDGAVDQDGDQVTLDWLAPAVDGGAAIAEVHKGAMFGGYAVYQTRDEDDTVVRYPTAGYLTKTATKDYIKDRTFQTPSLASGEYVYRVAAANIAGESGESISKKRFTIVAPGTTPPPPTGGLPDPLSASYDAATSTTSLTAAGSLAANGFGVIDADALPDIQRLYAEGGTISVLNTSGTSKDIVISEIMWGLNLAKPIGAGRDAEQFIELYNTTGAAINLSTVTIVFDEANTLPAVPAGKVLLDQVSNVQVRKEWVLNDKTPGKSGYIPGSQALVSMYRNIDYDNKVEKTHDADAAKNRAAQLKDFPDGNAIGSWASSDANTETYGVNLVGSPGAKHYSPYKPPTVTAATIDRSQAIISEIGNHSGDQYDWLELRNKSNGEVNLKNWELSQVTSDKKDTALVTFPNNDNHKIPAGGVLLIVNTDPYRNTGHPLAAGTRINGGGEKTGSTARYYVDSGLKLKDGEETLLILRNANDKEGKSEKLKDVVGSLGIKDDALRTDMWPLAGVGGPHGNVIDGQGSDQFSAGRVYIRKNESGGTGEKHWGFAGYTGVGYKRAAAKSDQNGGTPGYDNGAVKVNNTDLGTATVTISEIMYDKGKRGNLPQWIELYNSSMTQAVNISEWKLKIEHSSDADDVDIRLPTATTNNLGGGVIIPPNQTVLIVSNTSRVRSRSGQGGVDFPSTRIIDLWAQRVKLRSDDADSIKYRLLSGTAFKITLMDKGNNTVDTVGNLDAGWELPMPEQDNFRSSIIRRYDDRVEEDGTMENGWVLASDTNDLAEVRFDHTYYGASTDIATPGYRGGGPLPVSLSKFRPERLESGDIVIRWSTESELNNAGFNILRSETRNGQFTQINTSLIAGQGTTSEKTNYEWKDATAKPNVVYYYQIQDVSLDGKVQTLRQSRLKGYLSPAGKLATTWGDLKSQD